MKKLVVLGAGESGTGAAILGQQKGYHVFVSDFGAIAEKYKKVLSNNDIKYEEGKHTDLEILSADLIIKSRHSWSYPLASKSKEQEHLDHI